MNHSQALISSRCDGRKVAEFVKSIDQIGGFKVSESYRKGLEEIAKIDPESGYAFAEELKELSPDFAEYFVEFAFGKIHARSILEKKLKELIAIAYLISLGNATSHLRLRIQGACRAGCSKEEIIEVIIQSVVYVGFAKALIALHLVREVCAEFHRKSE